MMTNVGIDLVEFEDLKARMSARFVHRILSERELALYEKIHHPQRKLEFLGGRFAAKEAYTKAYRSFDEPLNFVDVEVLKDELGAPYIVSKYRTQDSVEVSISHSPSYVVAICMIEKKGYYKL
jgi:holo-[acyl-carrier protein] synthase